MSGYPVSNAFWSTSSAWYSATVSAQAASAKTGAKTLAGKESLWRSNGAKYLRGRGDLVQRFMGSPSIHSEGSLMVRVDPRLTQHLLDFVEKLNPAIVAAMDAHIGRLAFAAWREWPVSTGLSKSLIGLEYHAEGDKFTGQVVNTAPYVLFIEGSPHRKLLEGPASQVAVRIALDVERALKLAA